VTGPRPAAYFDFDRTIHDGDSGVLFGRELLRLGTHVGLVKRSRVVRTAYEFLKGLSHGELQELANDFVQDVVAQRIYPDALREMRRHREEGRPVVVVSTGMRLLIEPLRAHLPIDDVIAIDLVAPDGVLTGAVLGPLWGQEKAQAVRAYAHQHELSLPRSWAYSDHRSDLPLLRLVGHPVVVNPDVRLRLAAYQKDWPVVRWRR
jgi:HAD superfamily hydrolase (TIGR01490 family)